MTAAMSPATIEFFREYVRKRAAIVLDPGKEYLIESRLGPVAKRHQIASLDALAHKLRASGDSPLATDVVEAMTTNETSFFRDIHPFEALKKDVLPALIAARKDTRSLRIWCAAASTGQEPYTIAMTIRENFRELDNWHIQFVATDINETVLSRAREGIFKQLEVNRGLPAQYLLKYFDRKGTDFQVKPELRKMVTFQPLNLLDTWPLQPQIDVVFIRNVLIYFDVPTKRDILGRIRKQMRSDGYLFLGGAETTINVHDGYEPIRAGSTVYYRPRATEIRKEVQLAAR